jgi:hypothetical protein
MEVNTTTIVPYLDAHGQTQYIAVQRSYRILPTGERIPVGVRYITHDSLQHECKLLADGSLANLFTGATYRVVWEITAGAKPLTSGTLADSCCDACMLPQELALIRPGTKHPRRNAAAIATSTPAAMVL